MNPAFFDIVGFIILMSLYSITILDLYKLKGDLKRNFIIYEKDRIIKKAISRTLISSAILFILLLINVFRG